MISTATTTRERSVFGDKRGFIISFKNWTQAVARTGCSRTGCSYRVFVQGVRTGCSYRVNRGAYRVFEKYIYDCIAKHDTETIMRCDLDYGAELPSRPTRITCSAWFRTGCEAATQVFSNPM